MTNPLPRHLDEVWAQLTGQERRAVGEDLCEHEGGAIKARLAKLIRRHHKRGTDAGLPRPAISLPPAQQSSATPADPAKHSVDTLWAELGEHERLAVCEDLEEHEGTGVESRFAKLVLRHHLRAENFGVVQGRSQEQPAQPVVSQPVAAAPVVPQPSKMAKADQRKDDVHASIGRVPLADRHVENETNIAGGKQQSDASARHQGMSASKEDAIPSLPVRSKEFKILDDDTVSSGTKVATNPSQYSSPSAPKNLNGERQTASSQNRDGLRESKTSSRPARDSSDTRALEGVTSHNKTAETVRSKDRALYVPPPKLLAQDSLAGSSSTTSGNALSRDTAATSRPAATTHHAPEADSSTSRQAMAPGREDVSTASSKRRPDDLEDRRAKKSRTAAVPRSETRAPDALSKTDKGKIKDGPGRPGKPTDTVHADNITVKTEAQETSFPRRLSEGQSGSTTVDRKSRAHDAVPRKDEASRPIAPAQSMNTPSRSRPADAKVSSLANTTTHSPATERAAAHATSSSTYRRRLRSPSPSGNRFSTQGAFGYDWDSASANSLESSSQSAPRGSRRHVTFKEETSPSSRGATASQSGRWKSNDRLPEYSDRLQNIPPAVRSGPVTYDRKGFVKTGRSGRPRAERRAKRRSKLRSRSSLY